LSSRFLDGNALCDEPVAAVSLPIVDMQWVSCDRCKEFEMSPVKWPRVLIASDQILPSEGYAKLLQPEFQVVGIMTDEPALLAAIPELKPDVIIFDVGKSSTSGLETRGRIKKLTRMVRIVYLTTTIELGIASETLRAGVSGYLLRGSCETELLDAVREVLKGKRYISASIMHAIAGSPLETNNSHLSTENLTGRQREVLKLLAEGRTMKEIAYVLTLTPRTVAFHKYKLMERLGLQTNADLIQYAIQEHIVAPRS
jgi:DNA-binding NarL/FixJ family response regulator